MAGSEELSNLRKIKTTVVLQIKETKGNIKAAMADIKTSRQHIRTYRMILAQLKDEAKDLRVKIKEQKELQPADNE